MKILVCDDSDFVRSKISTFLIENNYEVIETSSGQQSIDLFQKHSPDIIIMDIILPDINGIDVMVQILEKQPKSKVIILSSIGQQTKIIEALQKGAVDYLVKPFDPARLLTLLIKHTQS